MNRIAFVRFGPILPLELDEAINYPQTRRNRKPSSHLRKRTNAAKTTQGDPIIPRRTDLKQLCEVSKTLYDASISKLYENLDVWAEDEWHLEKVSGGPFLRTRSKAASLLDYVKAIQVRSCFHHVLKERCLHYKDVGFYMEGTDSARQPRFEKLATSLMPLFDQLREESLRSFSWEMGTCIPSQIMGELGCIQNKQSSVETISLITGGSCSINTASDNSIDLSLFYSLRDISWTGLRSLQEFGTLSCALKNNSKHLKKLRLDFVNWSEEDLDEDEYDNAGNFFAIQVLKLVAGPCEIMFPALATLSLSAVSLENMGKGLAHAFNLSRLSSLTLRHCPGSEEFLNAVIDSGQTIQLSSLEVACGLYDDDVALCAALSTLIKSFQGLRDLFITLPAPVPTLGLRRSMAHHKSTLARFVCRERTIDHDENSLFFEEEIDLLDLSPTPGDRVELDPSESYHPFAALNLECIGLGSTPQLLKSVLLPFTEILTLKILHIRKSGIDMEGPPRTWRGTLLQNWDMDSDDDGIADEDLGAGTDSDVIMAWNGVLEDRSSNERTSNRRRHPRFTYSTASANSFNICEMSRLPPKLRKFANWAFGPDGLPMLEVLAFGDFSHDGRFHNHNRFYCRHTRSIRTPGNVTLQQSEHERVLTFRPIRKNDKEWDLIDRNKKFLEACPTNSIIYD
ncbi:hypothetical protein BGZ60DRAFT_569554 [Tricladium varicosporioides]|nr:hypothetical protein BGZ60DRAFT_569554 [Hymenoscyphus varicosporioides]